MDIFAHTLWANAAAREANVVAKKENKKFHLNIWWASFWGVFPDLFAFSIPAVLRFYDVLIGSVPLSHLLQKPPLSEEGALNGFDLAHNLYRYSHSLIILAVVFLIVWFFYKRPRYELLGWLLHILIDIPSHTIAFFPTPFLFPLSDYKFPYGVQWSNEWYMIINYSLLVVVWWRILVRDYLKKRFNK